MNQGKFYAMKIWAALLLLVVLVPACGNPTPEESPPSQTELPAEAPTESPTELPTEEPEQSIPWLGQECPDVTVLEDIEAYRPFFEDIRQEGEVFVQTGQYTNDKSQVFIITVRGRDPEAIAEYTRDLKVCMELLSPDKHSYETDVTDEVEQEPLTEDQFLQENPMNLVIIMEPSDEQEPVFGDGYIWVYIVDPPINSGQGHDYPRYCRNSASTKVTMGSTGSVDGTHYKNTSASKKSVSAGTYKSWTYPYSDTRATFDLYVYGTSAGSYRYSVSGTIWNYGFYSVAPVGGGIRCP